MFGKSRLVNLLLLLLLLVVPFMPVSAQPDNPSPTPNAGNQTFTNATAAVGALGTDDPFGDFAEAPPTDPAPDAGEAAAEATEVPNAPIVNNYFMTDPTETDDNADNGPTNTITLDEDLGVLFAALVFVYGIAKGIIDLIKNRRSDLLVKALEETNHRLVEMAERAYDRADNSTKRAVDAVRTGVQFVDSLDIPGLDAIARSLGKKLVDITDGEPETPGSTPETVISTPPLSVDERTSLILQIQQLREERDGFEEQLRLRTQPAN